jgi:hypothetical protein
LLRYPHLFILDPLITSGWFSPLVK